MPNRHLARCIVMQTLYQWDFKDNQLLYYQLIEQNLKEFGTGLE